MKKIPHRAHDGFFRSRPWCGRSQGFTLIELLMVIAVIAILAALLLPAIDRARSRSKRTKCVGQLNQIGVAFHSFAHDHDDRFPQGVPVAGGGVQEFAAAAAALQDLNLVPRIFRALSNELVTPELVVCPSSRDRSRFASPTFGALTSDNVSYFVGLNAIPYNTDSWLAGDSWGSAAATLVSVTADVRWLRVWSFVHEGRCNILFADGHVESLSASQMVTELTSPQLLVQPAAGGSGGSGSGTASGGGPGSPGGGAAGGTGNSYGGGSAAAPAGASRRGSGAGTRSGFTALDNFFQPSAPSPSPGADGGMVNPPAAPTLNRVSEPPPSEAAPYAFAAVTKTTNQVVSKSKSSELVKTQAVTIEHSEVRSNVVVLSLPGNITLDEKFLRWWLVLAVVAVILGIFIGTRRGRRKRPHGAKGHQ